MINLDKERVEIPIYFSNKFDFESMRESFNNDLADLEKRFIIKDSMIIDRS